MLQELFFPSFISILAIVSFILIPRHLYKKYFIYSFFTGAITNTIIILVLSKLLHLFEYKNLGFFIIKGFPFYVPIAFLLVHMLYLYFLPIQQVFLYPYIVVWAIFGLMFGMLAQNIGVFDFLGNYIYAAPFVYLAWFGMAAWVFRKFELKKQTVLR